MKIPSKKKDNMLKRLISGFLAGLFVLAVFGPAGYAQRADEFDESTEVFVYERSQRRDPFISLIDKSGGVKETIPNKKEEMMEAVAKVSVGGIIWDEEMPLAMINNEIRKIGDVINGLTVKQINSESVTFAYYDLTYTITIIEKKDF